MNNNQEPKPVSNKALLLSLLLALIFSIIIYMIIILPAEFNKDPTGLGEKLGLTVLSQTENTATPVPEIAKLPKSTNSSSIVFREDEKSIIIPPLKGVEYKFNIEKFETIIYEWKTTDDSQVYFDFHGEPEGDTTGYFQSYSIATTNQMKGTATVPFNGSHGWYWENLTDKEVTIDLKTSGNYLLTP